MSQIVSSSWGLTTNEETAAQALRELLSSEGYVQLYRHVGRGALVALDPARARAAVRQLPARERFLLELLALGVPAELIVHNGSGEVQNSAASGKWDVAFMPVDEERKKFVDFGNPYHLLQSTYLVAPGSKLLKVEDANETGVRIGGVANTATFRAAQRTAPKATFVTVPGVDAAVAAMKAGEIDCIALSRESLSGLTGKIPGSRVLDGGFLNSSTAVAVPKGKPDALAYVSQFVEDAKATGMVRKAFDAMDLKNSQVAPAGMKP